jgi:hypothetical protein
MTTSFFTQKNFCAALGILMALTIVLKANQETNLIKQAARFEISKPTAPIGKASPSVMVKFTEFQKVKSQASVTLLMLGI